MYNVVRHTHRFNTDEESDLADYDKILNDPLCTIVREIKEKISDKQFGEEGQIQEIHEYIVLVVTWDEKTLL